jgi:hypothetical protein
VTWAGVSSRGSLRAYANLLVSDDTRVGLLHDFQRSWPGRRQRRGLHTVTVARPKPCNRPSRRRIVSLTRADPPKSEHTGDGRGEVGLHRDGPGDTPTTSTSSSPTKARHIASRGTPRPGWVERNPYSREVPVHTDPLSVPAHRLPRRIDPSKRREGPTKESIAPRRSGSLLTPVSAALHTIGFPCQAAPRRLPMAPTP